MSIRAVLKSLQEFVPKLITRFQSIQKKQEFPDPSTNKIDVLRDSKDVAKARQNIKNSLYTIVDTFFGNMQAQDVKSIREQGLELTLDSERFEILVN